jgi:hypothetical protein
MKYTILINQAGIVDAGFHTKTDVIDWCLLDYIFSWEANKKVARRDGKVWINYKHLISEMPLLGLNTKGAIANRIKKLRELGLLETLQDEGDKRLYVLTTAIYYDITQFRGVHQNEQGVHQNEQGVHQNEQGVHQNEHSYNHQDTTIKTNYQEHKSPLYPASENKIFDEKELPPPSANRPTVDKEVETLTADDVVKYLAAKLLQLPIEEAQLFISYYKGQGWFVGNSPVASWRDKAEGWYLRYKQRQNEAATKNTASKNKKPAGSYSNGTASTKFEMPEEWKNDESVLNADAIDSTATPFISNFFLTGEK